MFKALLPIFIVSVLASKVCFAEVEKTSERDISKIVSVLRPFIPYLLPSDPVENITNQQIDEYVKILKNQALWERDYQEFELEKIKNREDIVKNSCDSEIKSSGCKQTLGSGLIYCLSQSVADGKVVMRSRCVNAIDPDSDGKAYRITKAEKKQQTETIKKSLIDSDKSFSKWPECRNTFETAKCTAAKVDEKVDCLDRYFNATPPAKSDVACAQIIKSAIVARDNREYLKGAVIMKKNEELRREEVKGKRRLAYERRLEHADLMLKIRGEHDKLPGLCASELKALKCDKNERPIACIRRSRGVNATNIYPLGAICLKQVEEIRDLNEKSQALVQKVKDLEAFK